MVGRIHLEMRLVLCRISPCQLVAQRCLQYLLGLLTLGPNLLDAQLRESVLGLVAHLYLGL